VSFRGKGEGGEGEGKGEWMKEEGRDLPDQCENASYAPVELNSVGAAQTNGPTVILAYTLL